MVTISQFMAKSGKMFTIQQTSSSEELNLCQQLLVKVFHDELGLTSMVIPDSYDPGSVHMQILDQADVMVGTYRIVLPSPIGLPIEESGFDVSQCRSGKICEMSRLVVNRQKRGRVPFNWIVRSACEEALYHRASTLLAAILPKNVRLFKRYGFTQIGEPLHDPSVQSTTANASLIVPMQIILK